MATLTSLQLFVSLVSPIVERTMVTPYLYKENPPEATFSIMRYAGYDG